VAPAQYAGTQDCSPRASSERDQETTETGAHTSCKLAIAFMASFNFSCVVLPFRSSSICGSGARQN